MDKLQMIALILEVFGFGLALLHTFKNGFSERINGLIFKIRDHFGMIEMDFMTYPADWDKSKPIEERDAIASRNFLFMITNLLGIGISMITCLTISDSIFPSSEPHWILILIFLLISLIGGFVIAILLHVVFFMIISNSIIALILIFGKDDFVGGIGFLIGGIGLGIETYQVWNSQYKFGAVAVWATVFVVSYIYFKERKIKP